MNLDPELQKLKEYLESPKIGVVNFARQSELLEAYALIKRLLVAADSNATIEMEHGALQLGSVAIQVVAYDITVYDMRLFSKALEKADNFQTGLPQWKNPA